MPSSTIVSPGSKVSSSASGAPAAGGACFEKPANSGTPAERRGVLPDRAPRRLLGLAGLRCPVRRAPRAACRARSDSWREAYPASAASAPRAGRSASIGGPSGSLDGHGRRCPRTAGDGCSPSASSCSTAPGACSCRAAGSTEERLPRRAVRRPRPRRQGRPRPAQPDAGPTSSRSIHDAYFEAGADITTTNTFTATSIGQADYGLQDAVRDMNLEGARLAREVGRRDTAGSSPARSARSTSPCRCPPRWTTPSFRTVSFEQVYDAYAEQIEALRDGGVDLLLIETIFDTLNAKAAIAAAIDVAPDLPRWISVTIVDRSGRTLSGQTVEAFWTSVAHADPVIVGRQLLARRPRDASVGRGARAGRARCPSPATRTPVCRTRSGASTRRPEITSALLGEFARAGLVNLVGGLLRHDARAHPADRGGGRRRRAARAPAADDRSRRSPGWSRSGSRPRPGS